MPEPAAHRAAFPGFGPSHIAAEKRECAAHLSIDRRGFGARCLEQCVAVALACYRIKGLAVGQRTSPDNAYLDELQGEWEITGTLLGKPVKYHARGERVLQGGFLRLHMIDLGAAPNYEAELFLGFDAHAGDYVVHWLDRFGAAGGAWSNFATYTLVHPKT
jgi:hypothetical protein